MSKIIFFDWDGTLQSKKVSEHANVKRTKMFSENLTEKEIIKLQHNSNNDHYNFVQNLMKKKLPIDDINELRIFQGVIFGYFYINYVRENEGNCLLFDIEKLKKIKEKYDLKLVITTTLYEATIKTVLKLHSVYDLFDGVFGCPVDLSTTKEDNLKKAIENVEGEPFLMVGDRGEDVEAGKKFNLKTIYCNYGHGINNCNCDYIIGNSEDLLDKIEEVVREN